MTFRSRPLLDLARDESCVACGSAHGVVAAHSNLQEHGKGMGHKASDAAVMFLCATCHSSLDQGREMDKPTRRQRTFEWIAATYIRLVESGKLVNRRG